MVPMPYTTKGSSFFKGIPDGRTLSYIKPNVRNNKTGCLGLILPLDESKGNKTYRYGRVHYHRMDDAPAWRTKLAHLLSEMSKMKAIPKKKFDELSEACYFIPIIYDDTFDLISVQIGLDSHGAFVLKSKDGFIIFDPNDTVAGANMFGNYFRDIITGTKAKHKLNRYYAQKIFKTKPGLNSGNSTEGICNVYQMALYLHWKACKSKGVDAFVLSIKDWNDFTLPKVINHYCVQGIEKMYK